MPSQIEVLTAGQLEEAIADMPDASQIALSQNRESMKVVHEFVKRDKNARETVEAEDIEES